MRWKIYGKNYSNVKFCTHYTQCSYKSLCFQVLKIYRRILCREMNMGIQVVDLHKDGEGTIPNPVQTFEEAFAHHRKYVPSLHNDIFA